MHMWASGLGTGEAVKPEVGGAGAGAGAGGCAARQVSSSSGC